MSALTGHAIAGAREVVFVDKLCPLGVAHGVEFEKDRHGFALISAFVHRVEQAHIGCHVALIVICNFVTCWRTLVKFWLLHLMSLKITTLDIGSIPQK